MNLQQICYVIALIICGILMIRLFYEIYIKNKYNDIEIFNYRYKDKLRVRMVKLLSEIYCNIIDSQYLKCPDVDKERVSFCCVGNLIYKNFFKIDPEKFIDFTTVYTFPFVVTKDIEKGVMTFIIFKEKILDITTENFIQHISKNNYILSYNYRFNNNDSNLRNAPTCDFLILDKEYFKGLSSRQIKNSLSNFISIIDSTNIIINYKDFIYDNNKEETNKKE